jgi:hypothetical protein
MAAVAPESYPVLFLLFLFNFSTVCMDQPISGPSAFARPVEALAQYCFVKHAAHSQASTPIGSSLQTRLNGDL